MIRGKKEKLGKFWIKKTKIIRTREGRFQMLKIV